MTAVAPDLLERLRRTLAAGGVELTPTRVAEALRGEGLVLGHDAVLEVVDDLGHRLGPLGAEPVPERVGRPARVLLRCAP